MFARPWYGSIIVTVTPALGLHQMTGGAANVVFGRCHPDSLHPDLAWLEDQLQQPSPPRMVVLVNPNNPTGGCPSRFPQDLAKLLQCSPAFTAAEHSQLRHVSEPVP